jgi:penicillin-binding protein 1C
MKQSIYYVYGLLDRSYRIMKCFFGYLNAAEDEIVDGYKSALSAVCDIGQRPKVSASYGGRRPAGRFSTFRRMVSAVVMLFFLTAAVAGIVLYVYADAKSDSLVMMKIRQPSVYVTDVHGEFLCDIENGEHLLGFWRFDKKIPAKIKLAILAAEDRNFYNNHGIDYPAVIRSAYRNMLYSGRAGASTIAMQVVRMENPAGRSYINKLVEMFAARKLVRKFGHEAVIAQYLTIAPFGNRYNGIRFAAMKYFRKPAEDLTSSEAALLCAIPKSPNKFNLYSPAGRMKAVARAKLILGLMRKSGSISDYEYSYSMRELGGIPAFTEIKQPECAMHAVLKIKSRKYQDYVVRTSVDLELQEKISRIASGFIGRMRNSGADNLSVVIASKETGGILAYLGSADYADAKHKGSIDYADTPRSSGSTLKPFLYAYGMMKKNFTGATILSDISTFYVSDRMIYQPENADYQYEGPVLYRYALANSRNIPAIQVLNEVGINGTFDFFRSIGLEKSGKSAEYYGLNLAIGGLYVKLTDLVRAYGMLANDGKEYDLNWRPDAKPAAGKILIPTDIARMITLFISDPEARVPAFPRMGNLEYPFPVAIKTGTSQGYRDAWACAYTDRYVIGVWVGDPDNNPMNKLAGLNSAALLMRLIIDVLHPDEMRGLHDIKFQPPEGYIARNISKITGKLAGISNDAAVSSGGYSPEVVTEWFKPGTEPYEYDNVFRAVPVKNGDGVDDEKIVAFLDQKYADWARANNITLAPVDGNNLGTEEPAVLDDIKIGIIEPINSMRYFIDPALPENLQTISLRVKIDPPSEQAVWYIDGRPYQVVDYPYSTRWQLKKGRHTFRVKLAYSDFESGVVTIIVE